MDLGLSFGVQSSSSVAADNSGIQVLGGGIQYGLSANGNTAANAQTPSQTTSNAVAGDGQQTPQTMQQPKNASVVVPSSGFSTTTLILLAVAGFVAFKVLRG